MDRSLRFGRFLETLLVAALLASHLGLALSSAAQKSLAFDEVAHLGGGILGWHTGDGRFNAESGLLPQRWAALPSLVRDLDLPPPEDPALVRGNVWQASHELFYRRGNDVAGLTASGRAMIALLSAFLGLAVYLWARRLFGTVAGFLALGLYALSPTILAHARLVTADLTAALFFLLASTALWRLLHRLDAGRLAVASLTVTGLLLSKHSGLLIVPVAGLLAGMRLLHPAPLEIRWRGRARDLTGGRRAVALVVVAVLLALLVTGLVWGAYGFRYAASPVPGEDFLHPWDAVLAAGGAGPALVSAARDLRLLPEAYLWGLAYTLDTTRGRDAFLAGRHGDGGWWWFFPYAFAVKTPLALSALLLLSAAAWWRDRRRRPWRGIYRAAPLWALLAVYVAVAVASSLNIGHRHLLPIYPVLFVFVGGAARWPRRGSSLAAVLVVVLTASFAVESFRVRPHYLAYFNPLAGGPVSGYRHLVDSSLDWGQDLPALAERVAEARRREPGLTVYVSYFGTADPAFHGLEAEWLPSYFPRRDPRRPPEPLRGGLYAVSATHLQTLHLDLLGPWNAARERRYRELEDEVTRFLELYRRPGGRERLAGEREVGEWIELFRAFERLRVGRLFAYLRERPPDARAGYSILLYRLSDAEVAAALHGPVPSVSTET